MIDHCLSSIFEAAEIDDGSGAGDSIQRGSVCILPATWPGALSCLRETRLPQTTSLSPRRHTTRSSSPKAPGAHRRRQEMDVVINISKARSGDWQYVQMSSPLAELIHAGGAKIKVISRMRILTMPPKSA